MNQETARQKSVKKDWVHPAYETSQGRMYVGMAEDVLGRYPVTRMRGKVQLVLTSPPFPLVRKKRYGNEQGAQYLEWLSGFARTLQDFLKPDGSIVIEIGNAWQKGSPTMSTLPMEALLAFKEAGGFHLCQEFIWYNPARLPSPAQWVNVERVRVKDSFTRLWWMSPSERPKADNRKVLQKYSSAMERLLRKEKYNGGRRPSEHKVGARSFLTNNGGAIPANVLQFSNTCSIDPYQGYCRRHNLGGHPARMPSQLAEFFVALLTDPGDLVMDPFAGSNTTGAVAESLRRKWLAIEASSSYVAGSVGRFLKCRSLEVVEHAQNK